jgi:DNA-binding transcriptional ArsR family regulator
VATLIESLKNYISEVLHQPLETRPWPSQDRLPHVLRQEYDFYEGRLFTTSILFLIAKDNPTPATTFKHQQLLKDHTPGPFVLVTEHATPVWRSRMIERGLSFIVPGNQLYLPLLGIDLREWFRPVSKGPGRVTPSAQVVLLWALLHSESPARTPTQISQELAYSAMTVSRALDQLEELDLVKGFRQGRERLFGLDESPRDVWGRAQPLLSTPSKNRAWVVCPTGVQTIDAMAAGLAALSRRSMLAEPDPPVMATGRAGFKELVRHGEIVEVESREMADLQLEAWSYPPQKLSHGPSVDCLSLYLSLRDDHDERVQLALKKMMEGLEWSGD